MKKIVLLIAFVLLIGTIRGFSQRCLPRQQGFELNAGWGDGYPFSRNKNMDYSLGVSFFRYIQNQNKWSVGLEYAEKHYCYKCNVVPLNQYLLSGGYAYNLSSNRVKSLFFYVTGTILAGYESLNRGNDNLCDGATLLDKNALVYGFSAGIELESYVTNRFLISIRAREKFLFNSVKTFHFQYLFSLKYIIN